MTHPLNADYFIDFLGMLSHPEGGYYKEIYRNQISFDIKGTENIERNLATSIYFLLKSGNVSKFHQLLSDEIWYYHCGSPVNIYIIDDDGKLEIQKLGTEIDKGHLPQVIIQKGSIFGANVEINNSFSLFGCMVSPGFDFKDFKILTREELLEKYPLYKKEILLLT